jgi:hypothetical protein
VEQRVLGRTGLPVSAISLGTEYLIGKPTSDAQWVIHRAIDLGVNYFDLFYGNAEFRDVMGQAFAGRRDKVMLTAHLGAIEVDGQGSRSRERGLCEQYLNDYLKRYETDYVDVLFLHNCDEMDDYNALMEAPLEIAMRAKREGVARAIGFSGHTVQTSKLAVETGAVDVLMFPINMMGHGVPGRADLLATCVERNVAVVAMKPYAGGRLLEQKDTLTAEFWHRGGGDAQFARRVPITPVQCLSYVLSLPGLSTIVPGCGDIDQLGEAQSYWQADESARRFDHILQGLQAVERGECVYCNHCLPCPSNIDIGKTIRLYELTRRTSPGEALQRIIADYTAMPRHASDCIQCAECEERCPFGVRVVDTMASAEAWLHC